MRGLIFLLFLSTSFRLLAQLRDSIQLQEVIITATKTERSLNTLPMPVTVIKAKEIQLTGTSRLQDILAEQTGLSIVPQVNGFGNGLQMQGLNPDYTLILMDGEPLIGRLTGNLELNRITLSSIKKIEIVKGPSSSLYGSEALGGVVNIITKAPEYNKLQFGLKYASHQTFDASVENSYQINKLSLSMFGNHFRTQGFDLYPEFYGQTIAPYYNTTLQLKSKYHFGDDHFLSITGRGFYETQENLFQIVNGTDSIKVNGNTFIRDYNISPQYRLKIGSRVYLHASLYGSIYESETGLYNSVNNELYYADTFRQTYLKPEMQTTCYYPKNQKWTAGTGINFETVETSRYADAESRDQNTKYLYVQHEWSIPGSWEIVSGLRYDHNALYGSQWSPKLAMHYSLSKRVKIKASAGTGFKSPDFRYLYLNFRNAAAGYYVFGTHELKSQLGEFDKEGTQLTYLYDVNTLGKLNAEKSFSINVGVQYSFGESGHLDLNFFRNDLQGLIETQAIAITPDRKTIYSYSNINKAFTQGVELTIHQKLPLGLRLELSAQLLVAKDKEVLEDIDAGQVFGRDPQTKESYRIKRENYFGLFQRSRHTEMLKIFYESKRHKWNASFRMSYKSKFGISGTAGSVQGTIRPNSDVNGNLILDSYDQFVQGYFLSNATLGKTFFNKVFLQTGIENIFNYTDASRIPNLPGRIVFVNVNYKLF